MKVIVCTRGEGLSLQEREAPGPPPPGFVKIDVKYVGICGTDRHIVRGTHPHAQDCVIPGHEISGTVAEAGDAVDLRTGAAVTVSPYLACKDCDACDQDRTNCCTSLNVMGVHSHGGLAEQIVVPAANVYSVSRLDLKTAAMIEVLAVGIHAVKRSQSCSHSRTLIIGCGPVGLSIAMCLVDKEYPVTVMDISNERVTKAKTQFGLAPAIVADGSTANDDIADGEFDLIFDATGCSASVSNAFNDLLAHGGTLVSVGIMTERLQLDPAEAHRREKRLIFTRNSTHEDFMEATHLADKYAEKVGKMITRVATLDLAPVQIANWATKKSGVLKMIVEI